MSTEASCIGQDEFEALIANGPDGLRALEIETIQVNIGLTCDLACRHCHLECSPNRTEQMSSDTMQLVLSAAKCARSRTIDITGGAPEMNPHFRDFVRSARAQGLEVLVRTNLTIMLRDGNEDLPDFLADHNVHLIASLPCYTAENVNSQRGSHAYEDSANVIQQLNAVGFGRRPELPLDLVYNPLGPALPPDQVNLERDYREQLRRRFDIRFTRLYTIANMPIGRFLAGLRREGRDGEYLRLLRNSFNPQTLDGLMCRHQIHVSWDGTLHDCDFNYALDLPVCEDAAQHIRDFEPAALATRRVVTGPHCLGCTAGRGSSCGGALT
ncbi:MAG: arsenosugar biosynthesis radical SAM protein ArsS [Phycisphaerae bacterium]|nr:arsenosugar biosynthesis radical SAM protein ArsS [Phycisphaerae bacterium]